MRHKRDHPEYKYQPRRRRVNGGTNTGSSPGGAEGASENFNGHNNSSQYNVRSPQQCKVSIK